MSKTRHTANGVATSVTVSVVRLRTSAGRE